jgi:hypothetical protein
MICSPTFDCECVRLSQPVLISIFSRMMGSLLLSMAYGIDPKTVEHPYIHMAETTIGVAATAGAPGAFLVDVFPWRKSFIPSSSRCSLGFSVKYVPDWVPGAGFQKKAKYWRKIVDDCAEEPYNYIKELVVRSFLVLIQL